jgi:hypothetical protein
MARRGARAAFLLAVVSASNVANIAATKAAAATTALSANPRACVDPTDFFATNCQLTWQGITVYGIVDAGFNWQSHGAPFDPRSAVAASYLIQKQNRSSLWSLAPNGLSNSTIGIKGTEPIGANLNVVFALDAGFDPYSLRFSNGPGSVAANAAVPQNLQTA